LFKATITVNVVTLSQIIKIILLSFIALADNHSGALGHNITLGTPQYIGSYITLHVWCTTQYLVSNYIGGC